MAWTSEVQITPSSDILQFHINIQDKHNSHVKVFGFKPEINK